MDEPAVRGNEPAELSVKKLYPAGAAGRSAHYQSMELSFPAFIYAAAWRHRCRKLRGNENHRSRRRQLRR